MGSEEGDYEEELVGSTTDQRNWRGIIIALLVIITVLGLIVTAIVLVTPKNHDVVQGYKLTFKDFMRGVYEPKPFHPEWGEGEKFIYRNDERTLVEFDCAYNSTTVIMDNSTFRELDTSQYKLSADRKYAILPYDIQYIYRYSQVSRFKIYDTEARTTYDLIGPKGPYFQYVTWSSQEHSLVYVQENNIYYQPSLDNTDLENYIQITNDGVIDQIYNGIPDWLYEEEILHSDNAIWQSPDDRFIAYATISDTDVYRYDMTLYGNSKYVENKRLAYPKAGTPNPTVTLKVFDLNSNETRYILPPLDLSSIDHYLMGVTWKDSSQFLATWLNRPQNISLLAIYDATRGVCVNTFRAEADGGWIDIQSPEIFTPSGNNYFVILPQKDGEAGNFRHIAIVDATVDLMGKPKEATKLFVTAGKMDVQKILGFNFDLEEIYFTAIKQDDPRQKHLYSATILKDSDAFRQPTCLSCGLYDDCLYVDARFSRSGRYYILSCKGPGVPTYSLRKVPNTLVLMLEDNMHLRNALSTAAVPKIEYLKIPIENDQFIWAKLLLPPILKKEEILTYNLLMKVYGAPNTQHVTYEFDMGWETYLSSEHDLIIAYVDGRGSGGRGDAWLHSNYKSLGRQEVEDSLAAAKHLKSLHYINQRTAIWGLSHGGFLTSAILGNNNNVFDCGVAVAPVTDWRYYAHAWIQKKETVCWDPHLKHHKAIGFISITEITKAIKQSMLGHHRLPAKHFADSFYTERYMGFPTAEDNLDAYSYANISRYASNFRKTKFLLIHGTADDNVHFQNSAQLIKALTEKDVYFRTQIYTDQQHWLNGGNTRTHLYNTMENFLFQCYGKPTQQEREIIAEMSEKDDEVEE